VGGGVGGGGGGVGWGWPEFVFLIGVGGVLGARGGMEFLGAVEGSPVPSLSSISRLLQLSFTLSRGVGVW